MSTQFDPLKTTAPELHRFWFTITSDKQWYAIMREAREWFGPYGKPWRCMKKVRRKLQSFGPQWRSQSALQMAVWFDVPDPRFATWVSVKLSLEVQSDSKFRSGK